MTGNDSQHDQADKLRQRAETTFRDNIARSPEYEAATPEETQRLLHELRVHQIELEMQNEELRRAQVELDAARARYFDLYDLAPVGYVTVSEQGLILEANLTAATLLGVARGALVTLPLSRFIIKADQDSYYLHRKQLLESGTAQAFELRMAKKDGEVFWAHLEATMAHDRTSGPGPDGGRHRALRVVISNITEHKQLEDTRAFLLQCGHPVSGEGFFEGLARHLAQVLGMGYVCIDRLEGDGLTARTLAVLNDGGFESNVTYALKDTPCGDVVGKTICCFPRDVTALFPRDAALLDLKAESYIGTTLWSHDGRPIGLIAVIGRAPLVNRGLAESIMKLVAIRAAGELERQQAVAVLRESEERLRGIIDASPVPLALNDEQQRITFLNPAFVHTFGYGLEDIPTLADWWPKAYPRPEYRQWVSDAWQAELERVKKSGDAFSPIEADMMCKNGAAKTILASATLLSGSDTSNHLVVLYDITERKRLAEAKVRLEDQLRQSQKMEAIGRLAGGVAHDFNNIAAIVLGYGEMLLGQLGPEDRSRTCVKQIVTAGQRAATLTRQLLAFSRRQTLLPEVLDLNALLRNLDTMLNRVIREDIHLEYKLAADLGHVTADPGQLEQVVTNLVLNARDAMPGGGRLGIETTNVELDARSSLGHEGVVLGSYVLLALTDTGCGMDQAALARLFEPFYTTKAKGKGTGLGLAMAYGIVKQSGGYIWAYSEPGVGTSFKIYLPRTDADPQAKTIESDGAAMLGSGELILLVEDEAPLRELCETILAQLGYRVSAAAGGTDGLRLVREQGVRPDLVLTDVIMPGMSGAAMAAQLRADHPDLKILYMSGYPDEIIAPHGVLAPGTNFIQKPFSERAIAAKIRETLAGGAGVPCVGRRVLMIDDDEQFRELVRHHCTRHGHDFAGVDAAAAAINALAGSAFDVLLVDLNIPGTSGERVLREIRAAGCTAPAIVLTGDVASADMAVLRPLGAVGAVQKSSDAAPLLRAIGEATAAP